jgi:hypothetical protein
VDDAQLWIDGSGDYIGHVPSGVIDKQDFPRNGLSPGSVDLLDSKSASGRVAGTSRQNSGGQRFHPRRIGLIA